VKGLLDTELLSGAHELQTGLRPRCIARCVSSLDQARETAAHLCQSWGGAGNPIVPINQQGTAAAYLQNQLIASEVDGYTLTQDDLSVSIPYLERTHPIDYPAALIVAHERPASSRPLDIVDLDERDPWQPVYLATLGWMSDRLGSQFSALAMHGLDELDLGKIIPIRREWTVGSLDDLLKRLTDPNPITPRQFSTLHLASGANPNTGYLGPTHSGVPNRWEHTTAAGPNVIVVQSPGSIEDFALLWNLRSQWGDQRPMPIGVPQDQLDAEALRKLHEPGIPTYFGLGGGRLYLVSETVDRATLEALARQAAGVEIAEPADLLRLGPAPCRPRTQVQVWTDGMARVTAMTEADRTIFSAAPRRPEPWMSVHVPDVLVPTVGPLRGPFGPDYQYGRAQVHLSFVRSSESCEVRWPTTWTSLTASALSLGLDVQESQPGVTAMNLIRAIGDIWQIKYLCDPEIIALLYRLAERSGMSWWKERWARVERRLKTEGKSAEDISHLADELGRDELAVAPPTEGRQLAESEFRRCFGRRDATDRWLEWAVERRIIVKGIELDCPNCRVPFWLPVQEMAPPHTCPGCGRTLQRPYRSDLVTFKYRIGEVLRKCLELDAFGHVVALRWFTELFGRSGLVGAHPGVEFLGEGEIIGEADLLLLFWDGSMVPVEVKRRAAGLGAEAAARLDEISNALQANFDVICVMAPQDECGDVEAFKRSLPERPRFLLTLEQLISKNVVWTLGANPFESGIDSGLTAQQRHKKWVEDVALIGTAPDDWARQTVDHWRRDS
jgi:hypothetical protein